MEINEKQNQTAGSISACSSSCETSRMLLMMISEELQHSMVVSLLIGNVGEYLEDDGLGVVTDYCILLEVTEKLVGWSNLFAKLGNIIINQPTNQTILGQC